MMFLIILIQGSDRDLSSLYSCLLELSEEEFITALNGINECKLGIPKPIADKLTQSYTDEEIKVDYIGPDLGLVIH